MCEFAKPTAAHIGDQTLFFFYLKKKNVMIITLRGALQPALHAVAQLKRKGKFAQNHKERDALAPH